jgi:hypothetical protein
MALTIDQIVKASKIEVEEFEVPEWDGTVMLRGVSKRDQQVIWKEASGDSDDPTDMNTALLNKLLLQHGMVDPVVNDDAFEKLSDGYAGTLDKIVLKIMKISRFSDADLKAVQRKFSVETGE